MVTTTTVAQDLKWKINPYPSSMKKEHMESVAHQQMNYYICRPVKKEPPYWNHKWGIAQDVNWKVNSYKEQK